jgi:hypothetical protein
MWRSLCHEPHISHQSFSGVITNIIPFVGALIHVHPKARVQIIPIQFRYSPMRQTNLPIPWIQFRPIKHCSIFKIKQSTVTSIKPISPDVWLSFHLFHFSNRHISMSGASSPLASKLGFLASNPQFFVA